MEMPKKEARRFASTRPGQTNLINNQDGFTTAPERMHRVHAIILLALPLSVTVLTF